MADIRFYVNTALNHVNVGRLYPSTYSFNKSIAGNGALTLTIPHNPHPAQNTLVKRMKPNQYEIVVCIGDPSDNHILWAGFVQTRDPKRSAPELTITAVQWRAWPFNRVIPPKTFNDTNKFNDVDEYTIAYNLIHWATAPSSAPDIGRFSTLAGRLRDLDISNWTSVGAALDAVGQRDGGYEWDIVPSWDAATSKVRLDFRLWEPGNIRLSNNWLIIDGNDINTSNVGSLVENGAQQATRVYATSDGDDPTFVVDTDPSLGLYDVLLLETVSTYQGNTNKSTLLDWAHAERIARQFPYSTLPVTVYLDKPNITKYTIGDRVRVKQTDQWNSILAEGVRILDMTIGKSENSVPTVTLTLDLTDILGRDYF